MASRSNFPRSTRHFSWPNVFSSQSLQRKSREKIGTYRRQPEFVTGYLTAFLVSPFDASCRRHKSIIFPGTCCPRRPRRTCIPRAAVTAAKVTEGHILQFQTTGRRKLGRVLRQDGKRNWIVEDANGIATSVSPKQITFVLGPESTLGEVAEVEASCHNLAADSTDLLEVAWELVSSGEGVDGGNTATIDSIAQIVYDNTSPESLFTTYILLTEDGTFFKERIIRGQSFYEARKPEVVAEARAQREAEAEREREKLAKQGALFEAYQTGNVQKFRVLLGDNAETVISCLEAMAVELDAGPYVDERYGTNRNSAFQMMASAEQNLVRETMTSLRKAVLPSSAMSILVSLGVFSRHENLALRRADLLGRRKFSESFQLAADQLIAGAVNDVDKDMRVNLSHLITFAIDSDDTTEIDDAVSWDEASDQIFVHIADPSRYFPEGPAHPLVEEAMLRGFTLYLPTEKHTMFPGVLASELFSLNGKHADGCALTFGFRIKEDGSLDEDSVLVQPSLISKPLRLTYDEVNTILADKSHELNHNLQSILDRANMRQNWRVVEGGAILIKSTFSDVTVDNPDAEEPKVHVGITETDTKSWVLVSELMITACTVAAKIAGEAKLAVPFRGQEPFDYPPDEVLDSIPDGPARASVAFRNATGSEVKTEPMEHASLGLDSYLQVTSPIRRSNDLLTHFQLKSHLRGESPPYTEEEVGSYIARSAEVGRTLRGVENRTKRYWQLYYLGKLGPNVLHKATFVRALGETKIRLGVFNLDEYGVQITAQMAPGLKPGATTEVRITVAEPRTGLVRAECVTQAAVPSVAEIDKLLDEVLSDISSESEAE